MLQKVQVKLRLCKILRNVLQIQFKNSLIIKKYLFTFQQSCAKGCLLYHLNTEFLINFFL